MPILVYCVSRSEVSATKSLVGVAGLPANRTEKNQLAVFISRAPDPAVWLQYSLRTAAVEFHSVCNEIFKSAAIIPFRFPTIFQTDEAFQQHLNERAKDYTAALNKFTDLVQMELQVSPMRTGVSGESGSDYLRRRHESLRAVEEFSKKIKTRLLPIVGEWRERPHKEGVRYFALVNRTAIAGFRDTMRGVEPTGIKVRVSGPWPVSEFVEEG